MNPPPQKKSWKLTKRRHFVLDFFLVFVLDFNVAKISRKKRISISKRNAIIFVAVPAFFFLMILTFVFFFPLFSHQNLPKSSKTTPLSGVPCAKQQQQQQQQQQHQQQQQQQQQQHGLIKPNSAWICLKVATALVVQDMRHLKLGFCPGVRWMTRGRGEGDR